VPVKGAQVKAEAAENLPTGSIQQPEKREKVNKRIINHSFSRRPKR
jgi:hypothetical protein